MSPNAYPHPILRATAEPVASARTVVFDVSDEQPSAFGATAGRGEWGLFQDFLRNPTDVNGIAAKTGGRGDRRVQEGQLALIDLDEREPEVGENAGGRLGSTASRGL
jgi:hypothetical protein